MPAERYPVEVSVLEERGATIFAVVGEIDGGSAPHVRAELTRVLEVSASRYVVLDLARVTFFNSVGVALLFDAVAAARERCVQLPIVISPNGRVERVLEMVRLKGRLPCVHPSRSEACAGR